MSFNEWKTELKRLMFEGDIHPANEIEEIETQKHQKWLESCYRERETPETVYKQYMKDDFKILNP